MNKSDIKETPITDAATVRFVVDSHERLVGLDEEPNGEWVRAAVARGLEQERNALLSDLRRCEQQLITLTPVSDASPREEALAEALQLVLDDWANGNVILEDAMTKADRALNMPVTHTSHDARIALVREAIFNVLDEREWNFTDDEQRVDFADRVVTFLPSAIAPTMEEFRRSLDEEHAWQPDGGVLRFDSHPGGEAPHVHTTCAKCGARTWFTEHQWALLAKGCMRSTESSATDRGRKA